MPRTMPVGKMMPQAKICMKMWIHNVVSWGWISGAGDGVLGMKCWGEGGRNVVWWS